MHSNHPIPITFQLEETLLIKKKIIHTAKRRGKTHAPNKKLFYLQIFLHLSLFITIFFVPCVRHATNLIFIFRLYLFFFSWLHFEHHQSFVPFSFSFKLGFVAWSSRYPCRNWKWHKKERQSLYLNVGLRKRFFYYDFYDFCV